MQRAATGLATRVPAAARRGLRTSRRAARRARATTAATRCSPAPSSPGAASRVTAVLLDPDRAHAAGLAALRRAGGRALPPGPRRRPRSSAAPTWCWTGCSASAAAAGCAPRPPELAAAAADGAGIPVAVDVPSGVDADTGAVDGDGVRRRCTRVTFGAVKPGLVVGEGRGHAGQVHLVDIGLGPHLAAAVRVLSSPTPTPPRAWSRRRPGTTSTRRASSASSRDRRPIPVPGCCAPGPRCAPGRASSATPGRPPTGCGPRGRRRSSPPAARRDAGRVQAWVVGPGMGTDDAARSVLAEVLATDLPVVVDADALTLAAAEPALVRGPDARRPCSPRTTGSSRGSGCRDGRAAGPGGRGPPAGRRPGLRRPAQGRRHGGRRPRRDGVRERDRARRGWPRRAPATCWPASLGALLATGLRRAEAGGGRRAPARPDGPARRGARTPRGR